VKLAGNETLAARIVPNVTVGLIVCAVVLAATTVSGTIWRRRNGVLRVVPRSGARSWAPASAGREDGVPGACADAASARAVATRTDFDCGPVAGRAPAIAATGKRGLVLTEAQLGRPLGSRATLVQFSTAFCASCRPTRRILAGVADMVDGVTYVDIDAEANLALVRGLSIHSTPTVLVLGADGTIVRRGTGQPRKADVIAALGAAISRSAAIGAAGISAAESGAEESRAASTCGGRSQPRRYRDRPET
jgi:thiol-disulfide isomerase/thioredoxin